MISIVIDDNPLDTYIKLFPFFKQENVKGCVAVVTNTINKVGFLSSQHLSELQENGWEIMSHTVSHPIDLTELNSIKIQEELEGSLWYFLGLGIKLPINFVYPCHIFNHKVKSYVKQFYRSARGVDGIYNEADEDRYELASCCVDNHLHRHIYKRYIDKLDKNKHWLIFHSHLRPFEHVPSTIDDQVDTIKGLILYAKEKNIPIVTFNEALDEFDKRIKI